MRVTTMIRLDRSFRAGARVRLLAMLMLLTTETTMASDPTRLIDDFTTDRSALGTSWQGFTDRVMGGRSDIQAGYHAVDGQAVLLMKGQVRLDNNGGFIQVRLPLDPRGRELDASAHTGIRLKARAIKPRPYYLHVRTTDTTRPWVYYRAPLRLSPDWQEITVPWASFEGRGLRRPFDPSQLTSVALVAYGEMFEAHLEVMRLEWLLASEE